MTFPSKAVVDGVRKQYPVGCRVELVSMDDPYRKMPPGLKGTVKCVDDTGTVHVNWDNGSSLGAVYGEDKIKKIEP